MNWQDENKKIRRFLRDPDSNIWSDSFLKNCYNDEQRYLQHKTGVLETVKAIRVPPQYQMSYLYDWEWTYNYDGGKSYQCLRYHHQSNIVVATEWEAQNTAGLDVGETEVGTSFIHPWEAWHVPDSPNKHVPVWFPDDFHKTKYIAWDNEPIDYVSKKAIMSDNTSWQTQSGKPFAYYRYDALSNEFGIYPLPSTVVFDDIEGEALKGVVESSDDYTEDLEYGTIIDATGNTSNSDYGLSTDIVDSDDNILLIYEQASTDIEDVEDESSFPVFMRKYIHYGVLERAYSANTDGKIESLRKYWSSRKQIGLEAIKRYKRKRLVDRDYALTIKDIGVRRTRKHPKLPDTYPADAW